MKSWAKQLLIVTLVITSGILVIHLAMRIEPDETRSTTLAAWVQAVGSIGAILGAVWLASEQHRQDVARRKDEQDKANYLLSAELAWLSGDVVAFLNEFIDLKPGLAPACVIDGTEVADLLKRMSWCRQRAEHKGQLAMVGELRNSLTRTLRIVKMTERIRGLEYTFNDVENLSTHRSRAITVYNVACGVETHEQYCP